MIISKGKGKHQVHCEIKKIEDHLLLIITGGEKAHIGGCVICEPGETLQTIRLGTHHDYVVLEPLAQAICLKYNTTVCVTGGIHIDHATKEDIDKIIFHCKEIERCI